MTTLLATTLLATPATAASLTSAPTDDLDRPDVFPRKQAGALRTVHPVRAVGAGASSVASWYGPGFYGNSLACGGRMTSGSMHVAHRWLPCGTRLIVCYRRRCRRTWVADRGPFVGGRTFDLAAGLARSLGFTGVHTIQWQIAGR